MKNNSNLGFNELYTQFYKKSLLFVNSYVHDIRLAEDIVSESIVAFWEKSKSISIDNPQAYLFRILRNNTLDYLKHLAIEKKARQKIIEKSIKATRLFTFRINTV